MHFVRLNDGVEPLKDTISYTRGFVVPQWVSEYLAGVFFEVDLCEVTAVVCM
jgi:hypothetical protein